MIHLVEVLVLLGILLGIVLLGIVLLGILLEPLQQLDKLFA
jgi:hypothetical protein